MTGSGAANCARAFETGDYKPQPWFPVVRLNSVGDQSLREAECRATTLDLPLMRNSAVMCCKLPLTLRRSVAGPPTLDVLVVGFGLGG
jgi:hypothetical protein